MQRYKGGLMLGGAGKRHSAFGLVAMDTNDSEVQLVLQDVRRCAPVLAEEWREGSDAKDWKRVKWDADGCEVSEL